MAPSVKQEAGKEQVQARLKALAEEIYQSYRQNTYRQGYMEQAMEEVGALTCTMELEFEPLKEDKYLVTHTVNLKQ